MNDSITMSPLAPLNLPEHSHVQQLFNQMSQLVGNVSHEPSTLAQFKQKPAQSNGFDDCLKLGTLASLEGNIEAIHTNYQQAIAVSSAQHAYTLMLYANCLTPFGLFSHAANLMHQAYDFYNNLEFLAATIHCYGLAGRFHQVGELLKMWDKMSPTTTHQFAQLSENIIEFMDAQQVSDDDLQRLIEIAMSILRQNQLTVVPESIEIDLYAFDSFRVVSLRNTPI
jgi:tetratricopeptide (TPR) repeat protein